jgi:hypothetical protein
MKVGDRYLINSKKLRNHDKKKDFITRSLSAYAAPYQWS